LYEIVTIKELSDMLGIDTSTIRKYEQRKILPQANYRFPSKKDKNDKVILGVRIYTLTLAKELQNIFANVKRGVKITEQQQQDIRNAFIKEKTTTTNGNT
jgi:DNA-binding transcriptional MerR regulator